MDRTLRIIVDGQNRGGTQVLNDLQKGIKGLVSTTADVTKFAGGVAVAMKGILELGESGAGITRLRNAGDDLATSMGENFGEIVEAVRDASLETVSNTSIMAAANRSMMLGVTSDADEMANLMEVAAYRGRAMGLSTTQAFNDIVTGVGRMSPMILDNLGIVVDAERRFQAYADTMGISTDQIDAATKRQILLSGVLEEGNRQLEAAGGLAMDTAGKFERMDTALKNAGDAAKERFAPFIAQAADAIYYLLTMQGKINQSLEEHEREVLASSASYDDYLTEITRAQVAAKKMSEADRGVILNLLEAKRAIEEATVKYRGINREKVIYLVQTGQMTEAEGELLIAQMQEIRALDEQLERFGLANELLYETNRAKLGAAEAERDFADAAYESYSALSGLNEATVVYSTVTGGAHKAASLLYDDLNRNLPSAIDNFMKDLEWEAAGGGKLQQMFEDVKAQIQTGKVTPEEGRELLEGLFIAAETLQVELGDESKWDAAKRIVESLGVSWAEALQLIKDFKGEAKFDITSRVRIQMEYDAGMDAGFIPEGMGVSGSPKPKPGGFWGTSFTVPPGYPGDTYMVPATSGEQVTVSSPHGGPAEQQSGGNLVINQHFYNQGSAALGMALVNEEKRKRLNATMGWR